VAPLRAALTTIDSLIDRSGRLIEERRREIVEMAKGGLDRLLRRSPQRATRARYH
jgi:hypothetical protein